MPDVWYVPYISDCIYNLSQGICDSAQGFANAMLFLLFTKEYRVWIGKGLKDCCCPPRFGLLRKMHSLQVNANSSDVHVDP